MFQTWPLLTFTDASCVDSCKNPTIFKPFQVYVDNLTSVVNLLVNSCSVFCIILF